MLTGESQSLDRVLHECSLAWAQRGFLYRKRLRAVGPLGGLQCVEQAIVKTGSEMRAQDRFQVLWLLGEGSVHG